MAIDVRLTNAQATRLCELIARVETADFRTQSVLHVDGVDLRTLRNAAVRIMIPLVEELDGTRQHGLESVVGNDVHGRLFKLLLEQLQQTDRDHAA